MKIETRILPLALLLTAGMFITAAAQSAPARSRPALTTEDVLTTPAPRENAPVQAAAKQSAKADQSDPEQQQKENAWNEKFKQAQAKAKELERRADGVELDISRLRNQLFDAAPKDAGDNAAISARINQLAQQLQSLREQAATAQAEVDALKREGEEHKFQLNEGAPKLADGRPNLKYYQSRMAELREDFNDAVNRQQVIQLRLNDLNTRIRKNSGGVDEKGRASNTSDALAVRRLKITLQEEQKKMTEAQDKKAEAMRKIEDLRRQAVNAGIDPGDLN
ncbi:MAG: hypothetical protein U0Z53_16880 [Blastocatellia bacterium]